jgi:hypothetical protein
MVNGNLYWIVATKELVKQAMSNNQQQSVANISIIIDL